MLAKRIIPCLDVKDEQVVKGKNFENLEYAGDPVELAKKYNQQGADELVFLDITASCEDRKNVIDVVRDVAKQVFIPLTVGGGIRTIEDIRDALNAGADKVSLNTSVLGNPNLIKEAAEKFGSQCVVVAIDAKRINEKWNVFVKGGREDTGKDAVEWAKQVESLGCGEILLTSMDKDGMKTGYDVELVKIISDSVNIPVIASGGAGNLQQIRDVLKIADAALCASIFHYGKYTVKDVKMYLK